MDKLSQGGVFFELKRKDIRIKWRENHFNGSCHNISSFKLTLNIVFSRFLFLTSCVIWVAGWRLGTGWWLGTLGLSWMSKLPDILPASGAIPSIWCNLVIEQMESQN